MKNLIAFIKTKQFLTHFGLAVVSVAVVIFCFIKYLSSYTDHGEFVEVPDFNEKRITELGSFIQDKGVNFAIIDSIYDPSKTPGIVVKQEPFAKSKVKHNRTIYLYVTSLVPPQVTMPKLKDRSERQAKLMILSYGLKIGKVIQKPADCNGCVIEQMVGGKVVPEGQPIKKGSIIHLVVGVRDNYSGGSDSLSAPVDPETFDND